MKIAILGGGNVGTLMAAEFAYKGHDVYVYSSKPDAWEREIDILDEYGNRIKSGVISGVSSNLEYVVDGAAMIFVVVPAELFGELGRKLARYVKKGQAVGVIPGSGGAEFAFREIVKKGGILFGLQRVHCIARLEVYGKSVRALGRKDKLELATIPGNKATEISRYVSELFELPCHVLPNYLCVTLTPSNPILHTTRLYSMFQDYIPGVRYSKNYLFYEEWTDTASEILLACDEELQNLCEVIPLELRDVMSLREYYQSPTAEAMTKKISGIHAFHGLRSPMVEVEGGWIPDFSSRYFNADFPYGLKIIKDLAVHYGVATPHIDKVWKWYDTVVAGDHKDYFDLNRWMTEHACDKIDSIYWV